MKIYFAGSIRGGRAHADWYPIILFHLRTHGEVFTEHVAEPAQLNVDHKRPETEIYTRDLGWLEASDILVADVSVASLGVGYEIGWAEAHHKHILCLCHADMFSSLSAMIRGNRALTVRVYHTKDEIEQQINNFFTQKSTL